VEIAAVNDSSCTICSSVSKAKSIDMIDIGLAMQVALSASGIQNHAVIDFALLSTENRADVCQQSS
jgi:hypothetical protein